MYQSVNYMELARGLSNSNVPEVAELAKGYLKLAEMYDILMRQVQKDYADMVDEVEDEIG